MKVIKENDDEFKPFKLTILIESKKEAEGLAAIFNYHPIYQYLEPLGINPELIRDYIADNANCFCSIKNLQKFIKGVRDGV